MVHSIPWYIVLFVSIPESFLSVSIGCNLFNVKMDNKTILALAILNAIFLYFLRQLALIFGVHTLLSIIFLTIASWSITKIKISYLFICIAAGILIAGIVQSIIISIMIQTVGLDVSDIADVPWLNFVLFIPVALIMAILNFLIKKHNYVLYDLQFKC